MTTGLPAITYFFRLYVTSQTALSVQAKARLRSLCEDQIPGLYELEIIDVSEHPDLAETDKMVVIPTVVRLAPIPHSAATGGRGFFRRYPHRCGSRSS